MDASDASPRQSRPVPEPRRPVRATRAGELGGVPDRARIRLPGRARQRARRAAHNGRPHRRDPRRPGLPSTRIDLASALADGSPRLRADHDRALAEHVRGTRSRASTGSRAGSTRSTSSRRGSAQSRSSTDELRGELSARAQQKPAVDPSERARSSSRSAIDRAARDSHDRIAALAAELRTEVAVEVRRTRRAATGTARRGRRAAAAVRGGAGGCSRGAGPHQRRRPAELHVETGSLAGRLDELFGLRHADAQVARVANERLAARWRISSRPGGRRNARPACDGGRGAHPSVAARLDRRGVPSDRARRPRGAQPTSASSSLPRRRSRASRARGCGVRSTRSAAAIAAADARLAEHDSDG